MSLSSISRQLQVRLPLSDGDVGIDGNMPLYRLQAVLQALVTSMAQILDSVAPGETGTKRFVNLQRQVNANVGASFEDLAAPPATGGAIFHIVDIIVGIRDEIARQATLRSLAIVQTTVNDFLNHPSRKPNLQEFGIQGGGFVNHTYDVLGLIYNELLVLAAIP